MPKPIDSLQIPEPLQAERNRARSQDQADTLAGFRDHFALPARDNGEPSVYLCGNSLGAMPRSTPERLETELQRWASLGVEGHMQGDTRWVDFHRLLREPMARVVGARPDEVVVMNTLTVNLHLMLVSFFRPEGRRRKIVIERQAFPSDRFAVQSQLRWHGLDPEDDLIELGAAGSEGVVEPDEIMQLLADHGEEIALVMLPGVQYVSGQVFDLGAITEAAHGAGATVGFDLAHAAGNIPTNLHDSGCDFAVWCTYKYMNSGPGAVAGCFVHQRHLGRSDLPRFEGWWGHDLGNRFEMGRTFQPAPGADAWQLSNPPIMAMVPILASLEEFDAAGMAALRSKSRQLTGWFAELVEKYLSDSLTVLTPSDPDRRGCQLSLKVDADRAAGQALFDELTANGVIGDWREPGLIRLAPTPLYNRFEDVWEAVARMHHFFASR